MPKRKRVTQDIILVMFMIMEGHKLWHAYTKAKVKAGERFLRKLTLVSSCILDFTVAQGMLLAHAQTVQWRESLILL